MKKIKDLPKDTPLADVKVRLPKDVYERSSLPMYNLKNVPVYLIGWMMGDFFVKTNKASGTVYPMFWSSIPNDINEWEVVE
jgi:hypothetical protein